MQALHLVFVLAFCAAPAFTQSLLSVLQGNGFRQFAEQLQQNPIPAAGSNLIVYAPTDAALAGNGNTTDIARRGDDYEDNNDPEASYSYADDNGITFSPPQGNGSRSDSGKPTLIKHQAASSAHVYGTLLGDPEWVNLGPGQNQTLVEKSVPSEPLPRVFTGLGASARVTGSDIPFDGGVIRPIDRHLVLPMNLSYTLPFLGAERFGAALQKTGLLSEIDNTALITVLAPNDAAFGSANNLTDAQLAQVLKEHVVVGFPAYTPLLEDGQTYPTLGGSKVVVSIRDGVAYINGVQIVAGDAIIKNGVVLTFDKMLSPNASPLVPVGAAPMMNALPWQALAFTSVGLAVAAFLA